MDDRVIGCDLYNQVLTGDIACALTAAMNASNHTGPKVLVCNQEKSDGIEVQMDEGVIVLNDQGGA